MGNGLSVPGSGTGYFIRKDSKLFFITAKHVFIGCDSKDTCQRQIKRTAFPDAMDIKLTTNGIINGNVIPISIKRYRDTANCPWMEADIVAYQVMNTPTDTVYSLENLISSNAEFEKGSLSIYGYPASETQIGSMYIEKNSSHLFTDKYHFYENYKYKACGGNYVIDKVDYIVKTEGVKTTDLGGYSGSPVFIYNKQTSKWLFMGTFVQVVEEDRKFLFLKPYHSAEATKNPIH